MKNKLLPPDAFPKARAKAVVQEVASGRNATQVHVNLSGKENRRVASSAEPPPAHPNPPTPSPQPARPRLNYLGPFPLPCSAAQQSQVSARVNPENSSEDFHIHQHPTETPPKSPEVLKREQEFRDRMSRESAIRMRLTGDGTTSDALLVL